MVVYTSDLSYKCRFGSSFVGFSWKTVLGEGMEQKPCPLGHTLRLLPKAGVVAGGGSTKYSNQL